MVLMVMLIRINDLPTKIHGNDLTGWQIFHAFVMTRFDLTDEPCVINMSCFFLWSIYRLKSELSILQRKFDSVVAARQDEDDICGLKEQLEILEQQKTALQQEVLRIKSLIPPCKLFVTARNKKPMLPVTNNLYKIIMSRLCKLLVPVCTEHLNETRLRVTSNLHERIVWKN